MKRLFKDKADEGWAALLICILAHTTTERAFEFVENPEKNNRYKEWTVENIRDMEAFKKEGFSWTEIGDIYSLKGEVVAKAYSNWKQRQKRKKKCK